METIEMREMLRKRERERLKERERTKRPRSEKLMKTALEYRAVRMIPFCHVVVCVSGV